MPYIEDNKWTTPFKYIYNQKHDYRNLILILSIAYIKRFIDGISHKIKIKTTIH